MFKKWSPRGFSPAYFANGTVTIVYSVLETGHRVEAFLPIGSTLETQWGAKRVVGHEKMVLSTQSTEPFGV